MRQYYAGLKGFFKVAPAGQPWRKPTSSRKQSTSAGPGCFTPCASKLATTCSAQFLRTYYARFKDGAVTTADFIATANEVNGQDLTEFLNAWLYDEEMPPIPE
jgi:hypothetical protein